MGLNPSEIGYLYLADKENQGTIDLSKIQIVGSELSHIEKAVKPHPNMQEEMSWKQLLDSDCQQTWYDKGTDQRYT
jgi:hypothetical protein